ncbi:glycosyltransferase [Christiangramia crocea]|uniref:Glycosyltransferase n=1 Tax=Christiangramia crocea TaxID=2904124 RepID=A0A9X1UXZ2_9FLAO|nr:glycosyltransferase [Gramella crocea]MCG9971599.1 glycosyltransferase [Gramella crocea]
MRKKRILVATLNWGLGHAARCIPIIRELQDHGYEPVMASDGQSGTLLKKEFPHLIYIELPSYNIQYSKNGINLKWKLMMNSPRILNAIKAEKALTKRLVKEYDLKGIISDNRLGVKSKELKKNVFITHQLNVLSGNTSFLSSYLHQSYIKKFDQCWIPDVEGEDNLSGVLGHLPRKPENVKYIGHLSRFKKTGVPEIYDYLVLLSGPEPQRSILESILLQELKDTSDKVLFLRGVITEETQNLTNNPNINIKNYLYGSALQEAINCSKYIISRSGYTTLMDLSKLEKKAFFIPTPGQPEQEYLAERLRELNIAPFSTQDEFRISKLKKIENFEGLSNFGNHTFFGDLFTFFECE